MQLDDQFLFGQYKGLTLREVYQGTFHIDKILLKEYLEYCIGDYRMESRPLEFQFCEFLVMEEEILILPEIANPDNPESLENVVSLGDMSQKIEGYISNFFKKNWYGIIDQFPKFNGRKKSIKIIGGDPEYIRFLMKKEDRPLNLTDQVIRELESLEVYRLIGIKVERVRRDCYRYAPNIKNENFTF